MCRLTSTTASVKQRRLRKSRSLIKASSSSSSSWRTHNHKDSNSTIPKLSLSFGTTNHTPPIGHYLIDDDDNNDALQCATQFSPIIQSNNRYSQFDNNTSFDSYDFNDPNISTTTPVSDIDFSSSISAMTSSSTEHHDNEDHYYLENLTSTMITELNANIVSSSESSSVVNDDSSSSNSDSLKSSTSNIESHSVVEAQEKIFGRGDRYDDLSVELDLLLSSDNDDDITVGMPESSCSINMEGDDHIHITFDCQKLESHWKNNTEDDDTAYIHDNDDISLLMNLSIKSLFTTPSKSAITTSTSQCDNINYNNNLLLTPSYADDNESKLPLTESSSPTDCLDLILSLPIESFSCPNTPKQIKSITPLQITSTFDIEKGNGKKNKKVNCNNSNTTTTKHKGFVWFIHHMFQLMSNDQQYDLLNHCKYVLEECIYKNRNGDPHYFPLQDTVVMRLRSCTGVATGNITTNHQSKPSLSSSQQDTMTIVTKDCEYYWNQTRMKVGYDCYDVHLNSL